MIDVYKPSGAFGITTIPVMILFAGFGIGSAYLYQLFLEWIPFIYISFVLTLVFGGLLGGLGRLVVKAGHVRNILIALVIGLVIGSSSYVSKFWFQYEQYVWTIAEKKQQELGMTIEDAHQFVREKISFWKHIELRAKNGWALNVGLPVGGLFTYLVWLVEAGIVLGLAISLPSAAASEPYNETIGRWANELEVIMTLPINNSEMIEKIQNSNSVDELLTIPIPETDETSQFAVYLVNSIAGHEMEDAYLTVKLVNLSYDKDGNEQKKENGLIKCAILTSEQRKQLNENAELLNEAIAAYQEAKYSTDDSEQVMEKGDSTTDDSF